MPLSVSASTVKSWFQYRCPRKTRYETLSSKERDAIPILRMGYLFCSTNH
jgi:hypothetical protein